MTGAAMYEHTKKLSLKHSRYFEKKYKYVIVLKSALLGLAIGILVTFLIYAARYEEILAYYHADGMLIPALLAAAITAAVAALYILASVFILGRKFENMRGGYVKYRLYLKQLSDINDEDR